jgi:hypothetical protein
MNSSVESIYDSVVDSLGTDNSETGNTGLFKHFRHVEDSDLKSNDRDPDS